MSDVTDQGGRHRDPAATPNRLWPVVTLFGLAMAAVVAVVLWAPRDSPHAAVVIAGILAMLSPVLMTVWVSRPIAEMRERVESTAAQLDSVEEKVNGSMTRLIDKIPPAERDA